MISSSALYIFVALFAARHELVLNQDDQGTLILHHSSASFSYPLTTCSAHVWRTWVMEGPRCNLLHRRGVLSACMRDACTTCLLPLHAAYVHALASSSLFHVCSYPHSTHVCLHLFVVSRGQSTYEYITEQRANEQQERDAEVATPQDADKRKRRCLSLGCCHKSKVLGLTSASHVRIVPHASLRIALLLR